MQGVTYKHLHMFILSIQHLIEFLLYAFFNLTMLQTWTTNMNRKFTSTLVSFEVALITKQPVLRLQRFDQMNRHHKAVYAWLRILFRNIQSHKGLQWTGGKDWLEFHRTICALPSASNFLSRVRNSVIILPAKKTSPWGQSGGTPGSFSSFFFFSFLEHGDLMPESTMVWGDRMLNQNHCLRIRVEKRAERKAISRSVSGLALVRCQFRGK